MTRVGLKRHKKLLSGGHFIPKGKPVSNMHGNGEGDVKNVIKLKKSFVLEIML
jgi:hypothetical protein